MDLNIKNLWVVYIGGVEIWITETIVNTWIIMAILILLAVIARIRMTRFSLVPRGFQNVIE
ncbi:MAG: ATP synthase F0 subunit A, partial [Limnochordia bacterium]